MCGIVGAVSYKNVVPVLVTSLRRLEYRGYDSAGVAVVNNGKLDCVRSVGKIEALASKIETRSNFSSLIGIAHTRWATHGAPSVNNAHPQTSGTIALVHNGIIENYHELREQLIKSGVKFSSDTDTEVVAHLLTSYLSDNQDLVEAFLKTCKKLHGAYALVAVNTDSPNQLVATRFGSPLVVGLGEGENFIASDAVALAELTNRFVYLEDHDVAVVTDNEVKLYDREHHELIREVKVVNIAASNLEKGAYRHFMQKEIFEQPQALSDTIADRVILDKVPWEVFGAGASKIFPQIHSIQLVACGSSFHAALVGKYWLESHAKIPCKVEIASEFKCREVAVGVGELFIALSQSGETADTLSALRKAKGLSYIATLAICNVPESSLVRESELVFLTRAGIEIGVATTKAFTTQLAALLILAIALNKSDKSSSYLVKQLRQTPGLVEEVLALDEEIKKLAQLIELHSSIFYLGRGANYPIALEGALKMKEISYLHAEGYAAGELKHGALALIDHTTPSVVLLPNDGMYKKNVSSIHEISARGGTLIVFADRKLELKFEQDYLWCKMPSVDSEISPIIYVIAVQLLAYHTASYRGTDIDQPRNLAKSVTVE